MSSKKTFYGAILKDYIPIIIIGSLSFIGMMSILIDMIVNSNEDIVTRNKVAPPKQPEEYIEDTQIDYEDDLIINE